jgi:hypothetical protein
MSWTDQQLPHLLYGIATSEAHGFVPASSRFPAAVDDPGPNILAIFRYRAPGLFLGLLEYERLRVQWK